MQQYKILYLTQFAEIGGGETILLSLLEKLNRRIFEPIVLLPKAGQLAKKLNRLGVTTYYLNLPPYLIRTFFVPGTSPSGISRFIRLAKMIKPDIIHINHLTLAVYAGITGKLLHIPIVATAHGPWDSYYFYQDLITNLSCDKILTPTEVIRKLLLKRKIINSKKVNLIPFGIDTNKFKQATKHQALTTRKALGFSPHDFVVTIVGRLDPAKDHLTFLKAAFIVSQKIPSSRFLIVGSKLGNFSDDNNYTDKIYRFLKENPELKKRVVFKNFTDNMPSIYNATDVLVSTSPAESFGLVVAEAMACNVATITTNLLLIKNGQTGLLAVAGDPEQFAQKILSLEKSPKIRSQLGASGRKTIIKNYNIQKYVEKVQNIYFEFLDKNLPPNISTANFKFEITKSRRR